MHYRATPQSLVATLFVLVVLASHARSQSTFDIDPPMQADTNSDQITQSTDPSALPVFKFATVEIRDGKVIVSTASATQKLLAPNPTNVVVDPALNPAGIIYTENVTQTYTVMVPTEVVKDGKSVTVMVPQAKTRTVFVQRVRKRNAKEQAEFEERVAAKKKELAEQKAKKKPEVESAKLESVTIQRVFQMPYTEIVDGESVARLRLATQPQQLSVLRGKTKTTAVVKSAEYEIGKIKAYTVDGTEIPESKLEDRISDRIPVILVNNAQAISPYFKALLKPKTIFLVCPEK